MLGKQTLRREADAARTERGAIDLSELFSAAVSESSSIASYLGYGSEPFVTPEQGWLLPVLLEDDDLDWARYGGELASGRRGLLEPTGPRLGVGAIAGCDIVVVPALLVDRRGNRLGKGGGSYDRALTRATGLTVALVADEELVDELPHEAHDVPVRAVLTPSRGLVHLS